MFEPKKTIKKATPVTIAGITIASAICRTYPALPDIIDKSGLDGQTVIAGVVIAGLMAIKDWLKHKVGLRIPYIL